MANLYTDYYIKSEELEKVSDVEKDIKKYIEDTDTDIYDNIIKMDTRWEVFFNLSEIRTSILNWYEFEKGAETLEIGAGFGALTGLLCKKCKHVTTTEASMFRAQTICSRYSSYDNLDVYVGELDNIILNKKFDYIVLVGILEAEGCGSPDKNIYAEFLKKLLKLLKTNGKILLAVENRYGIKYFCGAVEPHSGKAFDGINHYPFGTNGYSFSRKEITDIIKMAGCEYFKFYYPLPDYKLPQIIYSDAYLPKNNIGERLIPYYENNDTLLAYENDIYDDLVENNVFEFFANSFLIECSSRKDLCSVIYAAMSIDRGKNNGFITTIHNNDVVKKIAAYKEGEENLFKLYDNLIDIKNHGLRIVSHKIINNSLIMPCIKSMTLANYLKVIVKEDLKEFIKIFDKLYECILSSSEHIMPEKNILCNNQTRELNWGVVLKKAYIELIPLNSFYVNGEIIFFDQEFVKENYPAKYILFRALLHTYCFAPYTETIVPLNTMKQRYELDELWDIFVKEENRFITEVRNYEQYKNFYGWASIDRNNIYKNVELLESRVDKISNYKVSKKMKNIWAIQLDLLEKFLKVCEENSLTYYIIYGTLLGAVRHKGFIPWDDDIDIAMPREDYDKLKDIASMEFIKPYFLQSPENDPNCFYNGYLRLRNVETTGISLIDIGHDCKHGIWIDIMPLDKCPSNITKLHKKTKKIKLIQKLMYAKVYKNDYDKFLDMTEFQWKIYGVISKFIKYRYLCSLLNSFIMTSKEKNSEYIAIFTHYNKCQVFNKSDFDSTITLDFENLKLSAPMGYKRCLEMSVGRDYMEYPPVDNRKPSHIGIFNTEYSYEKYTKLFCNLVSDCKNKKIVIFGAGLMFEDYMKKYSKNYTPIFLVDNDKSKWGTKKHNIEVKSPNEILKIAREDLKIIICSVYYREIEEQLKQMGIIDYKIYAKEKECIVRDEKKGR